MQPDYQKRAGGGLPMAIRAIRLGMSLTGTEFGRLIGASPADISRYETGSGSPGAARLVRLIGISPPEHREVLLAQLRSRHGISIDDAGTLLPQPLIRSERCA